MRKLLFVGLSAGLLGCSLFAGNQKPAESKERDVPFAARETETPRKRILVLPFIDPNEERGAKVAELSRQTMIRNLARSDRFVFVAPSDLQKDPSNFIVNGEYNLFDVARGAEALGVAAIIEGRILDVKAQKMGDEVGLFRRVKAKMDANISVKMYSVKGNREILSQVKSASVEGSTTRFADRNPSTLVLALDEGLLTEVITKAFAGTIPLIISAADKLSWEGRIAVIEGPRIYLNAGRVSGLNLGDVLKVTAKGDEIYDPESGDYIGTAPGRMKGTLEVVSYFGTDGAICVVHSGSGFKESDAVELY
jgi:hypothetical protein